MRKKAIVIGGGIGGLVCASYLGKYGYDVTLIEKNSWLGGRIRTLNSHGFRFDMGPSWYWMPEVYEQIYGDFGYKADDFYTLKRLDPSYRVYFKDGWTNVPAGEKKVQNLFEEYEEGAGQKLGELLEKTGRVYRTVMDSFIEKPYVKGIDILKKEFVPAGWKLLKEYNGLQSVESFHSRFIKCDKLRKILSFPNFFLGASTEATPSVYAIMNHVDADLGTWYPIGGFSKVADAFVRIAREQGVRIETNMEAVSIGKGKNGTYLVKTKEGRLYTADIIVSNADYYHTEMGLVESKARSYGEVYWEKRAMAPSAIMFFIGLNRRLRNVTHHSLFFQGDWQTHNDALFSKPAWPEKPLFYLSVPTITDSKIAPEDNEQLIFLIPTNPQISPSEKTVRQYFNYVVKEVENKTGNAIREHIVLKKTYKPQDFAVDYHAYKGNAYGLAHTFWQTAVFRPRNRSAKLNKLYYAGQFTNPGIGVPVSAISGKITAKLIIKDHA